MKLTQRVLLFLAAATVIAAPALADGFSLSLSPSNTTLVAGGTYTFTGTLAADASNAGELFLIGENITVDSPLLTSDAVFYTDTPLSLAPGDSYTGALFTVSLPSDVLSGRYLGNLDVELDDINGTQLFQDASFAVTASPASAVTPEPGSWLLLSTGIAALSGLRRRFTRHAA